MSERHSMEPNERSKTAATGAMSAAKSQTVGGAEENPSPAVVDAQTVEALIADWPEMAKSAADEIIEKYGQPNEAIPSRLIWYGNGPWKRTVVYRHEIPHNFPNRTRTSSSSSSITTCRRRNSASWRSSTAASSWRGPPGRCPRVATWKLPTSWP